MQQNVSLRPWNSFGVESTADWAASVASVEQLRALIDATGSRGLPLTVLGGGSNVVLHRRVVGCVAHIDIPGITVKQHGDDTLVSAGAGVIWHDLVRFCLGQGLAGLENLALIPGRVGAAPMQNIGAYGAELAPLVDTVTAISTADGAEVVLDAAECEFGYRDSVFKRRRDLIVTNVRLRLRHQWTPTVDYPDLALMIDRLGGAAGPVRVAEAVIRVRRGKLPSPRRVGNAGSFFKNPVIPVVRYEELALKVPGLNGFPNDTPARRGVKIPAARLIDSLGWKGRSMGDAGVWPRQPLVLINHGHASGADLLALAERIRADVAEHYGVELELEPTVLGED